jgi:hypothetical protein
MEKYGILKEVEVEGQKLIVPLNATLDDIKKEAAAKGIEMSKTAAIKEISDDGTESTDIHPE